MGSAYHPGCKYYNLNHEYTVADLAAFHGHLGPYIVIGYRIGRYVRSHFCDDPFRMKVRVYCSGIPPESCLADGVQIGSGCTLGKRNIEIIDEPTLKCVFELDEKMLEITPLPFSLPERGENYEAMIEGVAEDMYYLPDNELFDISFL
jgi:formylmethanofuran dehydrogenase subunit E